MFGNSEEKAARQIVKIEIESLRNEIHSVEIHAIELAQSISNAMQTNNSLSAPKWEYLLQDDLTEQKLDTLGESGWELVSATSYTTGFGLGGNEKMTVHLRYVFKRPISTQIPQRIVDLRAELALLNQQQIERNNILQDKMADYNAW